MRASVAALAAAARVKWVLTLRTAYLGRLLDAVAPADGDYRVLVSSRDGFLQAGAESVF